MSKSIYTGLMLLFISLGARAQYTLISPYLTDPSLSIGYVDSCAQFWMRTLDEDRGGYFTNIDREGDVITAWALIRIC